MKNNFFKVCEVLFLSLTFFTFTACDGLLNELLGLPAEEPKIEKSGLAVNKFIRGFLEDDECNISLFYKTGTFSAEKLYRSSLSRSSDSDTYEGYFVYNSESKILYMMITGTSTTYIKCTIDLSGTKGSNSESPLTVSFNISTKTEFTNAIDEVSELPEIDTGEMLSSKITEDPYIPKVSEQTLTVLGGILVVGLIILAVYIIVKLSKAGRTEEKNRRHSQPARRLR